MASRAPPEAPALRLANIRKKTPLAIHLVSFTLFPFHNNHGSQDNEVRKLQLTLVVSMHSVNGMEHLERTKQCQHPIKRVGMQPANHNLITSQHCSKTHIAAEIDVMCCATNKPQTNKLDLEASKKLGSTFG